MEFVLLSLGLLPAQLCLLPTPMILEYFTILLLNFFGIYYFYCSKRLQEMFLLSLSLFFLLEYSCFSGLP